MSSAVEEVRRSFVESAGHLTQSLGAGRVLGQVYAHIYLSREAQSLDDLTRSLEISKGGASMAVRQLELWGALKRVWIKGDRKDYYAALDTFGRIIRKALLDMVGRKMELGDGLLAQAESSLRDRRDDRKKRDDDVEFLQARIERLRAFRVRAQRLWESPILTMLLK